MSRMADIGEHLLDEVARFFVGPRDDAERLPAGDAPLDTYTAGILFPRRTPHVEQDSEGGDDGGDSPDSIKDNDETERIFKRNSIGVMVDLRQGTKAVRVTVSYGKYSAGEDGAWARCEPPSSNGTYEIDLTGSNDPIEVPKDSDCADARIRWSFHENTLSVFLENAKAWIEYGEDADTDSKITSYDEAYRLNNENSLFQARIELRSADGTCPFKPTAADPVTSLSEEDDLFNMLYRNKSVFGRGYGCAVEWDADDKPRYVRTVMLPAFQEKGAAAFAGAEDDPSRPARIDMRRLCCFGSNGDHEADRKSIAAVLEPLISKYRDWIAGQAEAAEADPSDPYADTARECLGRCNEAAARMEDGYRLLTDGNEDAGDLVLKSFILANRAMLYQRLHFRYALSRFKGENPKWPDPKTAKDAYWYPFQLAFIVMSLRGLAFRDHDDGSIADLIWFPAGGGKTEAYLGVAAFTLILRRLRGSRGDGLGVSVIMRYTMKLLTLQQFERTSTLVCALEYLRRREEDRLGSEPFLLGLWVGQGLTPNRYEDSRDVLREMNAGQGAIPPKGSPCQTSYCPWCGHRTTTRAYKFHTKTKWTLVRCTNEQSRCIFTNREFEHDKILPLVTVDSDIYTRCPSMIIATVDKLAQLPLNPQISCIFGRASRRCEIHGFMTREKYRGCRIVGENVHGDGRCVRRIDPLLPPDLIIQDELHLISGPLGTMVGLYETAVDFLAGDATNGGVARPKIIAATATIRGAQDQIRKVFNRTKTHAFPPTGLDRADSFFWWETEHRGRTFVGVSFSQRSAKSALAKLYAAVLQRMQAVRMSAEGGNEQADPYWTLVGYHNSTRELGGTRRLVEDDVVQNMTFLADTVYGNQEARDLSVQDRDVCELVGGKTQAELNEIRNRLEMHLPDADTVSVLLATSMISVGIDIGRLALMVINGQPKTATEYIQVSGRVGRRESPGIVFVLLNPYKPRDMSHYEDFTGFHGMMQKRVEPSTLSPFSVTACERALHAVLIAMIRIGNPRLTGNESAESFTMEDGKAATEFILDRFRSVERVGRDSTAYADFEQRLKSIQRQWVELVERHRTSSDAVRYSNVRNPWARGKTRYDNVLMVAFEEHGYRGSDGFPRSTPGSLRDVEQQIMMEYGA